MPDDRDNESAPLRVLAVGLGHMGISHAAAITRIDGFELVGICSRSVLSMEVPPALSSVDRFNDFDEALKGLKPDAVIISTYPDTHADFAIKAMRAGAHVFVEKPMARSVQEGEHMVAVAKETQRTLYIGYILRVHPSWRELIRRGKELGKPLVMRMNINQQSIGHSWTWHKNLMKSLPPLVDCGVHYIDIMSELTGAKPVRVHGIGARLTDEIAEDQYNYGQLQVAFDDGSIGWYEVGWGPMMSEVAYFVKDIVGPKGAVSITMSEQGDAANEGASTTASSDILNHVKTSALRIHHSALNPDNSLKHADEIIRMADEPDHDALCELEQRAFLGAIRTGAIDTPDLTAAVDSLRVVLAADESIRTRRHIDL
ncbi:putative dehydrogenase [Rhizobium mesoamericanum]|uniref:Gfo/Idh/MocA family protein n=1 Tax=Rhizobium mesoamericanum TaxID=1079800 RepID=UPI00278B6DA5|nr:Gfo/Idh/MocA family oxidoreductase [Rhizobium mesoamericanum]MDQ0562291.1 putative dehydrogenase [Rhizobium mesoamericanum]